MEMSTLILIINIQLESHEQTKEGLGGWLNQSELTSLLAQALAYTSKRGRLFCEELEKIVNTNPGIQEKAAARIDDIFKTERRNDPVETFG